MPMTARWHSLYCPSADSSSISAALRTTLTAAGYALTDPFGRFPGKVYEQNVRLFVAPERDGWVRILAAPDAPLTRIPADWMFCLSTTLNEAQAQVTVYAAGAAVELVSALKPYLRDGVNSDQLEAALRHQPTLVGKPTQRAESSIPLSALPEDVQRMAGKVNMKQADKLFNRAAKGIFRGSGGSDDARALLSEDTAPNWDSSGGRQITALMACLTIPQNWREPDFTEVRDAYPLYLRKQRKPDAQLYPGDADLMALVPDALAYTPIYGGK